MTSWKDRLREIKSGVSACYKKHGFRKKMDRFLLVGRGCRLISDFKVMQANHEGYDRRLLVDSAVFFDALDGCFREEIDDFKIPIYLGEHQLLMSSPNDAIWEINANTNVDSFLKFFNEAHSEMMAAAEFSMSPEWFVDQAILGLSSGRKLTIGHLLDAALVAQSLNKKSYRDSLLSASVEHPDGISVFAIERMKKVRELIGH